VPGSGCPSSPPPVTPNQAFVAQLFLDLLGRQPGPDELSQLAGALDSGQLTRAGTATAILSSTEYLADIVQGDYRQLLGRDADSQGLADDVAALQMGASDESVRAAIIGSDEYYNGPGGGTDIGFVRRVYQDLLGRSPSSDELSSAMQTLSSAASRQQLAADLEGSPESLARLVESWYELLLRRPADAAGLSAFVADLSSGMEDQQAIAQIMGSDEYLHDALGLAPGAAAS